MNEIKLAKDMEQILNECGEKLKYMEFSLSFKKALSKYLGILRTQLSLCKFLEANIKTTIPKISQILRQGLGYSKIFGKTQQT